MGKSPNDFSCCVFIITDSYYLLIVKLFFNIMALLWIFKAVTQRSKELLTFSPTQWTASVCVLLHAALSRGKPEVSKPFLCSGAHKAMFELM